jgi:hypothetical protein
MEGHSDRFMAAWRADCLKQRTRVLTGRFAHYCADWDFLPVDETTPEFECCTCYLTAPVGG